MKTATADMIAEISAKAVITEREILLLKKRANAGEKEAAFWPEEALSMTPEQTEKGIAWLRDQWKTPRGVVRKNNPFGYREEEAIETFERFTFDGLYDAGNVHHSFYLPVYTVHGKESSFQYYVSGGIPRIIG